MKNSLRVGFVSLAALAQVTLLAQNPSGAEAEDVPGRGVARISLINGEVSVRRGDSGDVVSAAVNAALLASDRVLTGAMSRAELQLDAANRVRLAADSDLRLAEIEYRRYTVELGRGTITWHVSKTSGSDIDINTPSVSVRPAQPGDYRVTVHEDGTTEVTARTGEAEIYSPRGVERVRRGKTTLVRGDKANPEFQTVAEIREDDWDRFNLARDRELDRSESRQYLADDIVGAEELDNNGTWIDSAPYGRVWRPRVAAGWAPYSQGRWVWLDYYGWSWVSYDQFGWAPFHYGSWFHQAGGWCWYPGPRVGRAWWRPALVTWFGFGGLNVGIGFGNWGWVPLAPFERFRPWYGRGFYGNHRTNIFNNIRVVNNYNIVNNYRNARVDGGAHSVAAGQFGRSGGRYDRVGEANLRSAGLMQGQLPASPVRESLAFNDRRVNDSGLRGGYDGAFHSRRPAVAQERIPFAEQQRGIDQGARVFGGDAGIRGDAGNRGAAVRAGAAGNSGAAVRGEQTVRGDPSARGDQGIRGDSARGSNGEAGWRRVGERNAGVDPSASSVRSENGVRGGGPGNDSTRGDSSVRGGASGGNGWRRFGEPSTRQDSVRGESLGESVRGGGREVDPSVRGGASSSGGNGWRRFGEPASSGPVDSGSRGSVGDSVRGGGEYGRRDRAVDQNPGSDSYGDSIRGGISRGRAGDTGGDATGSPGYRQRRESVPEAPRSERQPRMETPRNPNPDGNFGYRDRSGSNNRSDSIRVNPPVVRDRSDSGSFGGASRGNRGGGDQNGGQYRSAPSPGPAYGGNPGGGGGSFGGGAMRGGSDGFGGGTRGGGGRSSQSDGNSGGSRGSDGGATRGGGGRRGN